MGVKIKKIRYMKLKRINSFQVIEFGASGEESIKRPEYYLVLIKTKFNASVHLFNNKSF